MSKDIKKKAEKAKIDATHRHDVPTLASVAFVAARQLKSGDLCLTLRSAKEVEIARTHPVWVKSLWKDAEVRLPPVGEGYRVSSVFLYRRSTPHFVLLQVCKKLQLA